MVYLHDYNCFTSAGLGVDAVWNNLYSGHSNEMPLPIIDWPLRASDFWRNTWVQNPNACAIPDSSNQNSHSPLNQAPNEKTLGTKTHLSRYTKILDSLLPTQTAENLAKPFPNKRWGLIFSSTKGITEDLAWKESPTDQSPFDPIVAHIQKALGQKMEFQLSTVVSNACASSHASIFLAKSWIEQDRVDQVLIVSGDLIGPFTLLGFKSLRALSTNGIHTYQETRDGLTLGEAVTYLVISKTPSEILIDHVSVFNDGDSTTRPSKPCLIKTLGGCDRLKADFVVGHGTGTIANDQAEVLALNEFFEGQTPPLTSTKWCVGHTLGASGSVDLIATAEILKRQKYFKIPLRSRPISGAESILSTPSKMESALITSLGFGGTHASIQITWQPPTQRVEPL